MADLGLLAGLGEGLKQGVASYRAGRAQNLEEERQREALRMRQAQMDRQAKLDQLQMAKSGFQEGPMGGLIQTPEAQRESQMREALQRGGLLARGVRIGEDMQPELLPPEERPQEGFSPYQEAMLGFRMADERRKREEYERKQKQAEKGKPLSDTRVQALTDGQSVLKQLPDIAETIEQNIDEFGPVTGRIASMNPYDETAQTIDAQMRASSQAFGRFMEGGVLRKEDEAKYRRMFPQLSDTPQVARNKLDVVRRLLAQKSRDYRQAFKAGGFDVSAIPEVEIPDVPATIRPQGMAQRFSAEDQAAINWALANKNDPRAQSILEMHGVEDGVRPGLIFGEKNR